MCLQCAVNAVSYGEVLPGWYLARATNDRAPEEWPKDHWGLIRINDPDFVWESTPTVDPYHGMTDNEINSAAAADISCRDDKYHADVNMFEEALVCDPETGYKLVEAAKAAGWDSWRHGRFAWWLFHRMGRIIRAYVMENK